MKLPIGVPFPIGQEDALRLVVGRGGDPDKADNYGNTALHLSSARYDGPTASQPGFIRVLELWVKKCQDLFDVTYNL